MEYDHILIRYGELALKGKNMKNFIGQLRRNLQSVLKSFTNIKIKRSQGRMYILLNGEDPEPIIAECQKVFGIYSLSLAIKVDNNKTSIKEGVFFALSTQHHAHTFKVAVRRVDKSFPTGSQEMNQILGGYLLKHTENLTVDVHHPDTEIKVEIRNEGTFITAAVYQGAGGLPVGTAGKSLLMLSGGIDSPVAGYLTMKRGVQLEMIHFHSPPFTSERAKQKVMQLAEVLTNFGGSIRVHLVPFTALQQEIFRTIPDRYAMTVMRRVMLQIREKVCARENIKAMVTGESLGQVASQTLGSMNVINEVTNYPVLRPLVSFDKEDIIRYSRQIGTYDISIRPYEDCCTVFVPKSPATNPTRSVIHQCELKADFQPLITEAIEDIEIITIEQKSSTQTGEDFTDLL